MPHKADVSVSRREVLRLAHDHRATERALKSRAEAMRKLATSIARFAPWPALQNSLLADSVYLDGVRMVRFGP